MRCTFCLKEKREQLCWSTLFWPKPIRGLCEDCDGALVEIGAPHCPGCCKPGTAELCSDCVDWRRTERGALDGNLSIYTYNDYMKEMIYQWKYRGDYEVGYSYGEEMRSAFRKLQAGIGKEAAVIPIPLSPERLAERGFNQAEMLARFLTGKISPLLTRTDGEKQSKKSKRERIAAKNPFNMTERIEKPVILVDDIYTTGATLNKAAELLKINGCPHVSSLTLVRG